MPSPAEYLINRIGELLPWNATSLLPTTIRTTPVYHGSTYRSRLLTAHCLPSTPSTAVRSRTLTIRLRKLSIPEPSFSLYRADHIGATVHNRKDYDNERNHICQIQNS